MTFSSVDFPQPDGPTMLTNLPSSTPRLMSSRTMNWVSVPGLENLFVRLRTVIAVESIGPGLTVGCDLTRAISMLRALCAMVFACRQSGGKLRPPGKCTPRPQTKCQNIDQHHHNHETHAPCEHHVDSRILEPVDELLPDAAACPECLGDQRDFP